MSPFGLACFASHISVTNSLGECGGFLYNEGIEDEGRAVFLRIAPLDEEA
jgi:hypothetical protein